VNDVAHPAGQPVGALRPTPVKLTDQFPNSLSSPRPVLNVQPGVDNPLTFKDPAPHLFSPTAINVDQLARKFDVHPHPFPSLMPRIHREPPPETSVQAGEPTRHHVITPIAHRHPDGNPTAAPTATPFHPPTEGGGNPTPKPSQPPTEGGNPTPKPSPKSSAPPTEGGNPTPKPSPPPTEGGHLKAGPPLRYAPPAQLHIWNQQLAPTNVETAESSTWIKITNVFSVAPPTQKSDVCAPCNIPCITALPKHAEPHQNLIPAHPEHAKSGHHHQPDVAKEHPLPSPSAITSTVANKKREHLFHPEPSSEIPAVPVHLHLHHLLPSEPQHHPSNHVEHNLPHVVLHHPPLPKHKPQHKDVPHAIPDCPPTTASPNVQSIQSVETHTSTTIERHVKKASGIYTDLTLNSDGTSNITVGKWLDRRNYVNVSVDAGQHGLGNTRLTAGHALIPAYNQDGSATKGTLNVEGSVIIDTGHSYNSSQLPVDGGSGAGVSVNGYRSVSADNNTRIYGSVDYVHTGQVNNETDTQLGVSHTIGHVPVSLGIEHTTVSDDHPSTYIQAGTSINLDKSGTKQFFLNATKSLNTGKTTVWGGVTISIK
jgi:hypothetical protein